MIRSLVAAVLGRPARSPVSDVPRTSSRRRWWRGLDSNQRTLARADLQSAAFNHSAASPGGQAAPMAARAGAVNALVAPSHLLGALQFPACWGHDENWSG